MRRVAEGVWVHESEFLQSNAVAVEGDAGVLLVDAGITGDELIALAAELREAGRPVVAGFSTHPHWDHLLWHAELGEAPRYGTALCSAAVEAFRSNPGWRDAVAGHMPPEIAGDVPLDLLGLLTGLPAGTTRVPWAGPEVRILEHRAHAQGHAALLIEERGVLIAGDTLSDVLIPMFDFGAADPIADHLAALRLLEEAAGSVEVVVPGHGSVGGAGQVRARIERDRAYLHAVRDGRLPDDPRIGPSAGPGWEWVGDVHAGQVELLARRGERDGTS